MKAERDKMMKEYDIAVEVKLNQFPEYGGLMQVLPPPSSAAFDYCILDENAVDEPQNETLSESIW